MTHKENSRRKVLIGLGSGLAGVSQLPKAWTKPVVDSVLLPAHATTSDEDGSLPGGNVTEFSGNPVFSPASADKSGPATDFLSLIVPEAYAGVPPSQGPGIPQDVSMCIDISGAPTFTAKLEATFFGQSTEYYEVTGSIGGAAVNLIFQGCVEQLPSSTITIEVPSTSDEGAVYEMISTLQFSDAGVSVAMGTLLPGQTCPTPPICG